MPRFVILEHDHPELHWDFMLEAGAVLRTWRLTAPPQSGPIVDAAACFDHRLHYLNYEGPVSGGRGSVHRWDAGSFSWQTDTPERIVVHLQGAHVHGVAELERADDGRWTFAVRPESEPV
jgi:hypothetical protein